MARECLRVDQLDARILDDEYRELALSQIESTVSSLPVPVSRFLEKAKPELELCLDATLWSTRYYAGASPGQIVEDIAYKDYSSKRVLIHFGWSIILPYFARRLPQISQQTGISKAVDKIEAVWEVLSITHYLRFLSKGGYSSPTETLLGLRSWNNNLPTIGTINYESQNRELLWHAFRDALLLAWPFAKLARRVWNKRTRVATAASGQTECGACSRVAVVPMKWECGHVCCYWCDKSRKEHGCVVCGLDGEAELVKGKRIV